MARVTIRSSLCTECAKSKYVRGLTRATAIANVNCRKEESSWVFILVEKQARVCAERVVGRSPGCDRGAAPVVGRVCAEIY